jgi:hypothetical protein
MRDTTPLGGWIINSLLQKPMAFHVTENLYYYIMQLVFKIEKYLSPIPGGGVHGQLGYASHLVLSCTPVEKPSTPAEKDLLVHTFSGF